MDRTAAPSSLLPPGWEDLPGLVAGFGSRTAAPPPGTLLLARQVHGDLVVDAADHPGRHAVDADDGLPRLPVDADAVVAALPGIVAGVRTADCVPLLLVAPGHGWAAAVHAGWKGTIARIAQRAVDAAARAGVPAAALHAALGPSIGPCCYQVSPELGERFASDGLGAGSRTVEGRPHLDLRAANRTLLLEAGLDPGRIHEVGPCTRCARDRYHSFRAEPESPGRQVSWIGWAARRPSPDRAPTR